MISYLFSDKLYFIDFEYGSYSYRGYDIANHFNEYAGFDCDYNLYVSLDLFHLLHPTSICNFDSKIRLEFSDV